MPTFQGRVNDWMQTCFGQEISADKTERNHRFLEEALELVQALGCTKDEAHQLVDYTFGRPLGEPEQEVGGVIVTLAALCHVNCIDMSDAGETELARVWTKIEKIRVKHLAKPRLSPLPEHAPQTVNETEQRRISLSFEVAKLKSRIAELEAELKGKHNVQI